MRAERHWSRRVAELRDELLALGRGDVWTTIEGRFPPDARIASDYHAAMLMRAVLREHGRDGAEVLARATERLRLRRA
jgi:hypothetical protein